MDILVDLDGTLVDPKPGLIGSVQYALDRLGHPVPAADELLWLIGPPFRVSFPKLLGSAERTEDAIGYYRESYFNGGMYDAVVYDGVPDALAALRAAGHRLIVATSKPHHYARPMVQHFGLAAHFYAIHGPELDGTNDHKADLIAHILRQEGILPETALMIGDREFDVTAAARKRHARRRRDLGLRQRGGAYGGRRGRALPVACRLGRNCPRVEQRRRLIQVAARVLGVMADAKDADLLRHVIHAVEYKVGIADYRKHANARVLGSPAAVGVACQPPGRPLDAGLDPPCGSSVASLDVE